MKVVIVGGGASGMIAAIYAARNHNEVTIIEKNKILGKKILITGNGKCNYYNSNQDLNHYHSTNFENIGDIINEKNNTEILKFFDSIGIIPKIKDGYYYPYSNQATSIQTALIKEIELLNIHLLLEETVQDIMFENSFVIKTDKRVISADKVILSTGSKAYPKTGSDGMGYELAKKFHHNIIKPLPALTGLRGNESWFNDWSGIRSDVIVSLYENDILIKKEIGEIQLTNYGVSGICIFNLSSVVARGLEQNKKEKISINFLPFLEEDFISFMDRRNQIVLNRTVQELLDGLLNYKLVNLILKLTKIDRMMTWNQLDNQKKKLLQQKFTEFDLQIVDTNSFEQSQVCSGGIPLNEINSKTMESKYQKGLYIIGELLDVDGDCGGYNLNFAWNTGYLAGSQLKGDLND